MSLKKLVSGGKSAKKKFSKKEVEELAKQYNDLSETIKELDKQKKKLAEQLKNIAETDGVEDDKGSSYLDLDSFIVGRVAKNSVKVDDEGGYDFLMNKGLKNCVREIVKHEVIQSEVEKAVNTGKLTPEDVGKFTSISTSYSVSVKKKEALPEVSQTTLKAAAKRK